MILNRLWPKNAIIVNSRRKNCFQQAIYALNLIDISFYGEKRGSEIGSENETRFEGKSFFGQNGKRKNLNNPK